MIRPRGILFSAAVLVTSAVVAAWAFGRGDEEWRYQLAGLADPLRGRPGPGVTIAIGVALSAVAIAMARIGRRGASASIGPTRRAAFARWWWPLIAGWAAYSVGAAFVISRGAPVDRRGALHVEFGAPLASEADVGATCRSVVGAPRLVAEVSPSVDGMFMFRLRNVATGEVTNPADPTALDANLVNDGNPDNDFVPPSIPDRPAAYMERTLEDGSSQREPALTFLRAYDFEVARSSETEASGVVQLRGTRFKAPADDGSVRWVNLVIPDDPWPDTFDVMVSWSCGQPPATSVHGSDPHLSA